MSAEFNPEVIYNEKTSVAIDAEFIGELKRKALANKRRRCRFCIHTDETDLIHEMLIVHTYDAYVRPHKHLRRSESFQVLEGVCSVVLFDESGAVREIMNLGAIGSGLPFYYKFTDQLFHTTLIQTDILVFLETTQGPFRRDDTVFPEWAPEGDNMSDAGDYMEELHAIAEREAPFPT
jgi:cupin fold WbuC family metalloprotein